MSEAATGRNDDNGGEEEPLEIGPPTQVSEESDAVLSSDEEIVTAAEPMEATAKTADYGGEELLKAATLPLKTSKEGDGVSSLDEDAAAGEATDEMAETPVSGPLAAEENDDIVLSSDEDAAAAEQTDEITEIPGSGGAAAEEPTVPAPLISEESDDMLYADEEPAAAQVEERDHEAEIFAGFSLESNGIRFRGPKSGKTVRVFEDRFNTQLILEETKWGDDEKLGMELRGTVQVSPALSLLRGIYSVIAVFMGSFLFILGINILLFLFIHLVSVFKDDGEIGVQVVASVFSVPVFVYSLASAMTLVTNFVADTFFGNRFLRGSGLGIVFTEWIAFIFYLGVPLLAFIVTLFMGKPNWWEVSLLTWFASVLTFWCFFSACVFYFEITHCLKIERDRQGEKGTTEQMGWRDKTRYWLEKAKDATKCTTRIRLSGKETKYKKQKGEEKPEYGDKHNRCPVGLCSLLTMKLSCYKQFDEEEQKKEILSLGEVLGFTTYVTRYSWSLDKLFCRNKRQTSSIFLTSGDARVDGHQIKSSIACRIIGNVLICLLVVGLFVWMSGNKMNPTGGVLFALLLVAVLAYVAYNTVYLKEILKDTTDQSETTWTRFWEVRRINEPSDRFVWFCVVAEILLFYLWPLISLSVQQNTQSAVLFAVLGLFSFTRHYLNGAILLRAYEHDFFSKVIPYSAEGASDEDIKRSKKSWEKKSRMYNMLRIGNATRYFWIVVFCMCVFFFVSIVFLYVGSMDMDGFKSNTTTLVEGYAYERNPNLPYPTCVLRVIENDLMDGDLVDYAFIANLAYTEPAEDQASLNSWFGDDVARVNDTLIEEFRETYNFEVWGMSENSPVSYKLVQSVIDPTYVMITIRGTATPLDVIADAQLWLSALLFQGVRAVLPVGDAFTPILHHLVKVVNWMETEAIAKVAYYQETRQFALFLINEGYNVRVTGHSLGGGLALITGAQAKVSAVGFSAPNAKLSRDTFVGKFGAPFPVSIHDLDTYTFNVVPDRDPVPFIDDKARLYQRMNCTASANDIAGCHTLVRTICELQYTCGSKGALDYRPVPCECVLEFGYPPPKPMNLTDTNSSLEFEEECKAKYPCKWGNATEKENEGC